MRQQIDAVAEILQTVAKLTAEAERARPETKAVYPKARQDKADLQRHVAIMNEKLSGRSITRLACSVLDHIAVNYSPVVAREPLPAALGLGGARGMGTFAATQCETMLIGWQPAVRASVVRAREVFHFVAHGRHLSPDCMPSDSCDVEVYLEEGVVAFFNRATGRGAKWAMDGAGIWHVAARI
jgi:hypothetical protein